jgi:hypothetical protein
MNQQQLLPYQEHFVLPDLDAQCLVLLDNAYPAKTKHVKVHGKLSLTKCQTQSNHTIFFAYNTNFSGDIKTAIAFRESQVLFIKIIMDIFAFKRPLMSIATF